MRPLINFISWDIQTLPLLSYSLCVQRTVPTNFLILYGIYDMSYSVCTLHNEAAVSD